MRGIIQKTTKLGKSRMIVQLAALALLSLPFLGLHTICAPVLYCHGCPLASMACPLGVLVNFATFRAFPFVTVGILGLVGTIGGRLVCGWLCPFGFFQDLLYRIRARKISLSPKLSYLRYGVLVVLVFMIPLLWPGKPYTFCHFCPAGTLESSIPWAVVGVTSGDWAAFFVRVLILVGVLAFAAVASRSWCRVLCPLGAIFSLFNRLSLFRLSSTDHTCNGCGVCRQMCPVEIDPICQTNSEECIRCLDCTTTGHIRIGTR